MNEQQLKDKINSLYTDYPDTAMEVTLFDHLWPTIKAYADAQVAETNKDAEILANALLRVVPESHLAIIDKDAEIKRLRDQLSQSSADCAERITEALRDRY